MLSRTTASALAALTLASAGSALAQPAPPVAPAPPAAQPAPAPAAPPPVVAPAAPSAVELRDRARTTLAGGDATTACLLFEQSYQAAKAPGSGLAPDDALFDLAMCHDQQGKRALAKAELEQVAAGTSTRAPDARARLAGMDPPPIALGPGPGAYAPTPFPAPVKTVSDESPTRIGDFMDTRLSWTFGDDDVLHATGTVFPLSPNASIGDRPQYRLFFDNLNSRFGGRENLTHLALYKKMPGFIKDLDTEASMVVRLDLAQLATNTNNLNQALYDAGSFIRMFYHTAGGSTGVEGLGLTMWPIDTDRFRLGYLYDITWGGTNAYINQSIFPRLQGSAPGAKLEYDNKNFMMYIGFKTATIEQVEQTLTPGTNDVAEVRVGETNYGVLGGAAADVMENLHLDVGGGYFTQGKFDLPDVQGLPIYTYGVSGRAYVHHKDMPVPQSIDFLLYRNDPNKPMIIFAPEVYTPGKTTWAVSLEYTNLFQNLKDFDQTGVVRVQQARAAAFQGNVKSGFLRASVTSIYRDLPFVLRNQPSMIPFETLPKEAATTNEIFFAGALDYYLQSVRLTPGIGAGLQFPATFTSKETNSSNAPINRTVVVRQQGDIAILPVNQTSSPIFEARVSLKWDVSPILSTLVWVQYTRDNNGTAVERDPVEGTLGLRAFVNPDFLGLGTSVQARF